MSYYTFCIDSSPEMMLKTPLSGLVQQDTCHSQHENMKDTLLTVYMHLINIETPIDKITIKHFYMSIEHEIYHVKYVNGIVLYNDNNNINVSSLYPELHVFNDKYYKNKTSKKQQHNNKTLIDEPKVSHNNKTLIDEPKVSHNNKTLIDEPKVSHNNKDEPKVIFKVENNDDPKVVFKMKNNDDQLNKFIADKSSYRLIKKDINNGKIKLEEVFSEYIPKYIVLTIMETRGEINFETNENIQNEHENFKKLYYEISDVVPNDDTFNDSSWDNIDKNY